MAQLQPPARSSCLAATESGVEYGGKTCSRAGVLLVAIWLGAGVATWLLLRDRFQIPAGLRRSGALRPSCVTGPAG
jgi:hypothetical protein